MLIALFGTIALGLAVVGIVGVVSYGARQRTMEIGVRRALGAAPREITGLIVRQAMGAIAIGVAAGVAGALALTHFMRQLLYGVAPTDPLTFGVVTVLLTASALVACWMPAARAARLDPLVALRSE